MRQDARRNKSGRANWEPERFDCFVTVAQECCGVDVRGEGGEPQNLPKAITAAKRRSGATLACAATSQRGNR